MATSMLLQATPRSVAELPVSSGHKNEMYTMLQAPSIGDVRRLRFGAGRKGYGVCRRRAVLIGFRAQSGPFTLPGIRKAKKDVSEAIEADVSEGTRKVRKLPGTLKFGKGKKDNKIVFVAGATGKVGSRVVRELLELGFQVQAGVRDVARGQALLETLDATTSSNDEPKLSWAAKLFKPRTPSRGDRVELVECDLENEDEIENSLGNAGVVVCAIGASEKEVLDTTGPYRIDYKATENLIRAASNAKVNHFILVTSLGTTKFGWPASALNLFWGVLIWKAKAEKALQESGLAYTIVRPGGMERPTDAFKETHNLILAPKDTYSGGQVSSLQVAELIARCVNNLELARYKVLEVVAETTAPLRPIEDLLAEVPAVIDEDDQGTASSELVPSPTRKSAKISRQQEEKSKKLAQAEERREKNLREKSQKAAEAEEKRKIDLQEKSRKEAEAAEKKKKELLARYERDLLAAREEEEEARRKVDEALSLKAQLEKRTADLQVQARTAAREAKKAKALENAIAVAARQARRLSEKNKREVLEAASAEFDGEQKTQVADTEKTPGAEKKTLVASTNSKAEKGLQFKALQAAKLKEAEDKAAKKSAETDRLAKQQEEVNDIEVKERDKKQETAKLGNDAKAKVEAETNAQAEKDRVTREENEARAKAEAEAEAKAKRDRVTQEENEARAKAKAEAEAKAKVERDRTFQEENKAKAEAEAEAQAVRDRISQQENKAKAEAEAEAQAEKEAMVKKARQAKEEAATRAAIALERAKAATSVAFLWPRQKKSANVKFSSETSTVNEQIEDVSPQVAPELESSATPLEDPESDGTAKSEDSSEQPSKVVENAANAVTEVAENSAPDEALLESRDSETSSPPSEPVIEEEVSKFAEEVVQDTEAVVETARQAKEDAATRAAIALEKAKAATSGGFQWPWQKESANEKVSSVTSTVNEQIEDVSPQVDSEPESSATPLEDPDSKGTTKSEDSSEQPSEVVEDATNAVTEVAENSAPDEALLESRDSETSSPPSEPVIEEEVSKFAEEVVQDTEAVVETARQAKEDAATRAAIALEKAKAATSGGFQWPWQKESANEKVSSVTSTVNEQIEDVSPQVDPEPESSATPIENSETDGTTEKSEDSSEQASSIINGLATAATEVAESAGEALDSTGVTNVVRDDEQGSVTKSDEENNGAPLISKKALEPGQEE